MPEFITLFNHLLPAIITLGVLSSIAVVYIGIPYLNHTALVASADSEEGIKILAKHLARMTGGRKINVDEHWESFVPAAKSLYKAHQQKLFDDEFSRS